MASAEHHPLSGQLSSSNDRLACKDAGITDVMCPRQLRYYGSRHLRPCGHHPSAVDLYSTTACSAMSRAGKEAALGPGQGGVAYIPEGYEGLLLDLNEVMSDYFFN